MSDVKSKCYSFVCNNVIESLIQCIMSRWEQKYNYLLKIFLEKNK